MAGSEPDTKSMPILDYVLAALLTGLSFAAYLANSHLSFAADGTSNVYLALSLINDGDMVFTPAETPLLFEWSVASDAAERPVDITAIDQTMAGMIDSGTLVVRGPRYLIVPSVHEGYFVSTFNPGTSLFAAPFFAVAQLFRGDLRQHPAQMWYVSKYIAAGSVAVSAAFVFLAVRYFLARPASSIIALAYALGTSVWTTSSQGLWQHGPVELFLAAACYLLVSRSPADGRWRSLLTGFVLGFATLCRPTIGFFVLAVGADYLLRDRRGLLWFILGGLPFAIFLACYNTYYLGAPWTFGETSVANHALEKTGSTANFSTPLWLGGAVGLFSPSRGLFIFSPFLAFSLLGAIVCWLDRSFRALRPLTVAVLAVWLTQFTYFDYWGGWSYGNRNLVDTTPVLAVLLAPIWVPLTRTTLRKLLIAATILWSIGLQVLGAFTFDLGGWNGRTAYEITSPDGKTAYTTYDAEEAQSIAQAIGGKTHPVSRDIDKPGNRDRFWSLTDSQIVYYLTHFRESSDRRIALSNMFTKSHEQQVAESAARMGDLLSELGDLDAAAKAFEIACRNDPQNRDYEAKLAAIANRIHQDQGEPK